MSTDGAQDGRRNMGSGVGGPAGGWCGARGAEERVMPNMQPLLRLYPTEDDTLCLHFSFLPYSSPPQIKDIPDKGGIRALETGKSHC